MHLSEEEREALVRVFAVAELADEFVNAPADSAIARRAEDDLTHAVDALEPGDLALLARLAGLAG